MPQKKKAVKKNVKKDIKKVVKNVIKNSKQQPLLKNSINIKIDLDDDNEKKKKPKRKKRQPKQADETANNNDVSSYVDEVGRPISNEIINNRSFNRSYMPQPFSRNSSVIGTSFNESTIIDKVAEKMSRLNTSNQSMNNTVLNQSTTAPTPAPTRPARTNALSTIAPASPSIAPQSLNFDLSSRVGLTPLQASSMAMNSVQQYAMSSMRAAVNSQAALARIFKGVSDDEQAEIKQKVQTIKDNYKSAISLGSHAGAQFMKFSPYFKTIYDGGMIAKEAASIAWQYYQFID
jgi:hypothetical protein